MDAIKVRNARKEGRLVHALRWVPPICLFLGRDPFDRLENEYRIEMERRGKIPDELWENENIDSEIKRVYDRVLKHRLWNDRVDFHPEDPYFVIGCFQTGDLSEVEVLMDVGDALKIKLTDEKSEKIVEMTYAQVLRHVKKLCST